MGVLIFAMWSHEKDGVRQGVWTSSDSRNKSWNYYVIIKEKKKLYQKRTLSKDFDQSHAMQG